MTSKYSANCSTGILSRHAVNTVPIIDLSISLPHKTKSSIIALRTVDLH